MIAPGEFVKVRLNSEPGRTIKWAKREYPLKLDKEVIVPSEAAILWFGDPRAVETVTPLTDPVNGHKSFIPDRPSEVRRLRFKYGAEMIGDETGFEGAAVPDVTVSTLEDETVPMVVHDPLGKTVIGHAPTIGESDDLKQLVAKQSRQIAALMQQLNMDDASEEDNLPPDVVPMATLPKPVNRNRASTTNIPDVGDALPEDND